MIIMTCYIPKERMELESEFIKVIPSNAPNVFQWSLIQGLVSNNVPNLEIINALSVGTWPKQHKKAFLRGISEKLDYGKYNEIATINLPVLKQLSRYYMARRLLRKSNESEVLIYSTYLPFLAAVTKFKNKKITLIVPDLPQYYNLTRVQSLIAVFSRKMTNRIIQHYLDKVDRFVLFTEAMSSALKVGERPYIVLEGIAPDGKIETQSNASSSIHQENDPVIVFYSGSLTIKFGVLDLITFLKENPNANLELWICGSGEGESQILEHQKADSRLKFFGFLPINEVLALQQQATILVNPRKPEGTYTKFSFPSKTMEYMVSGKPVVMYKLPGLPDEYDEFLFLVEKNETLSDTLLRVMKMKETDRKEVGLRAQSFMLETKSSKIQVARIVSLQSGVEL